MYRRGFTVIQLVVIIALLALIALILFPVFARRPYPSRSTCQSNLKQIGLGISQYLQDYDERWPQVSTEPTVGWANVLYPYLKSTQIFQCNATQQPTSSQDYLSFNTDYFLNTRLAGQLEKNIDSPALIVSLGEGLDNAATNATFWELPFDWVGNEESPVHRHVKGANYAFADGHVKWSKPEIITTLTPKKGQPTFAIR